MPMVFSRKSNCVLCNSDYWTAQKGKRHFNQLPLEQSGRANVVSALQTYLLTYRTHLCAPPRGIASADFEQNVHL